ncbi:MAG: TIR domain-containing protein [Bryobacteraceae bacterium]
MTTAFLAHARPDHDVATRLAGSLEFGCDLTCFVEDGQIGENQDLIAKAEEGLCADVLLLLLSPSSSPTPWVRERWEPVLFQQARQANVEVVTMLLEECPFPPLLRRRNFIDATTNWLTAQRLLKRWFMLREREPGSAPNSEFSGDLEDLYVSLADRAGTLHVSGEVAARFAKEAEEEFEAVLWVPCRGRTLAQAAGELGHQLGLALDGPKEENCPRIRVLLAARRCLVVLDAPGAEILPELIASGRTSTVITHDPIRFLETPESLVYARRLVAERRFAEAYELLYRLLDAVVDADSCARELTWICEHWDRVEEASVLRSKCRPSRAEQLDLF